MVVKDYTVFSLVVKEVIKMSEEMKMIDVFVGEVEQKGSWVSDVNFDYLITYHDEKITKYAAHAINVHDANQETITEQAERINELEEAIQSMVDQFGEPDGSDF